MGRAGDLAVVVLAAGKGTRMRSRLPKVLHPVCGRSIVRHQLELARRLEARRILFVVGTEDDEVRSHLEGEGVELVKQVEQLGTGHAVLQTRELLADHEGPVLVTYGDHALYRPETFAALTATWRESGADIALLVAELPDASAYGRIVRDPEGRLVRIVEVRDASEEVLRIREANMGTYVLGGRLLFNLLPQIGNDNEKGEYYLTDIVELALSEGRSVETSTVADWRETLGVNDRRDLAVAEAILRRRINDRWMQEGVTFIDPERTYVDADVEIGPDTTLEPGAALRGATRIGSGCRISAGSVVDDSEVGDDSWIKPHCWLERATLGRECIVGPSAHLRPEARLGDGCRVGNYVEVKNSTLGSGTKADHLSYVGDADVGEGVTIGCGVITVNYDSAEKRRTVIGDRAFVGCNSNLIAPVTIEPDAYVAAGSTVTVDVPAGALGVARARQRNIEGWRSRRFGGGDGS